MRIQLIQLVTVIVMSFGLIAIAPDTATAVSPATIKGLTVSPLRTQITIDPGTSQDRVLSISNTNDYPITVRLSAEEFSVINQQYDYAFNIETQLIKWVSFTPDTLDLAVGQTKTATYRIGVPLNAEPGGRYLSLFATTDAGTTDGGTVSQQRIASLLYITVNGNFSRSGHLVSLNTPWITTSSTDWSAALQNTGTTHYQSRYSVAIRPLLGENNVKESNGSALILPGTVRLISEKLPLPDLPGIYKVIYIIGLGDTPAKVETRYLVYMPPVAIIVSVFALILITSLLGENRSRKKKRVNQSAEQQYK